MPTQSPNPVRDRSKRSVPLFVAALLSVLLVLLWAGPARALVPERRRDFEDRRPNEYLLVPALASLPGIGVFAGVIGAGTNIGDTGINIAATWAESIDDSDIEVRALALQEVPLLGRTLTFDYQAAHIKLGNLETYLPGRDSPNFTIPVTGEFDFQMVRPVLRFSERRFTFWYTLAYFKGFGFDESGNEISVASHAADAGMSLDLTDDVVDPRLGVRFRYSSTLHAPDSSLFGEDSTQQEAFARGDDIRIRNYALLFFFTLADHWYLAWDNEYFETKGREDGGEIIPGGSPPLRGYPTGRWADRYGVFTALELRHNIPLDLKLDFILASGIVEEFQMAAFYELGQVAPVDDHTLYEDVHHSYGIGFRALFEAIVLRLDIAAGNEGPQTHLTIDQPFGGNEP